MEKDTTFEKKYQEYSAFIAKRQEESKKELAIVASEKKTLKSIVNLVLDQKSLMRQYGRLTMEDVLKNPPQSMKALAVAHGEAGIEAVIATLLERVYKKFGQIVRDADLMELAVDILNSEFHYLSIEDLFVCFKRLQQDETSFKLTPARIYKSISSYAELRLARAENLSYSGHVSRKFNEVGSGKDDFKEKQRNAVRQYNFDKLLEAAKPVKK